MSELVTNSYTCIYSPMCNSRIHSANSVYDPLIFRVDTVSAVCERVGYKLIYT